MGIDAASSSNIHHNVIYRNTIRGIRVNAASGVSITNNTIYTPAGDAVYVAGSSSNVSLRNNILWTENGYDLYVAANSQQGFASDYNNLFASGLGKLVWWQKDFTDLFDWQVEANLRRAFNRLHTAESDAGPPAIRGRGRQQLSPGRPGFHEHRRRRSVQRFWHRAGRQRRAHGPGSVREHVRSGSLPGQLPGDRIPDFLHRLGGQRCARHPVALI